MPLALQSSKIKILKIIRDERMGAVSATLLLLLVKPYNLSMTGKIKQPVKSIKINHAFVKRHPK